MIKFFIIFITFGTLLFAVEETSSSLTKQRIEVLELKKQLNNFYNEKETEYQQRKKELENILAQIEKEKGKIQKIHDDTLEILKKRIKRLLILYHVCDFEVMKAAWQLILCRSYSN